MVKRNFLAIIFFVVFANLFVYANTTTKLSLDDAIYLAVRDNPNVQSTQLSFLEEKFNLGVQEWKFTPHLAFRASAFYNEARIAGNPFINSRKSNIEPTISLLTPIGTELSLAGTNTSTEQHYNPGLSFSIAQPLIRGFGKAIVETALCNAKDSAMISRLNVEMILRNTVTAVINTYLDVVTAIRATEIDRNALERAEKSVVQTKLFIKAGHKAPNELVTVLANVASAKSQLENDKNTLLQARYALLNAIGLDPNANIIFSSLDLQTLINKYSFPTLIRTKQLVLQNDIQYQIDQITLHGSLKRTLMIAEDNTHFKLDFSATAATGNATGGGRNAGVNSLINGLNQTDSVGITLEIPIDDRESKQAVFNAKIALKQANLALLQEKWAKVTDAINGFNLVIASRRALSYAKDAESLQEKTYHLSYQKYLHGLIDSLEWQSAQFQLIQAQQNLLISQIAYIKSLVNLDLMIGNTLKTWNIKVRLE